jgi:hypothetical protein
MCKTDSKIQKVKPISERKPLKVYRPAAPKVTFHCSWQKTVVVRRFYQALNHRLSTDATRSTLLQASIRSDFAPAEEFKPPEIKD